MNRRRRDFAMKWIRVLPALCLLAGCLAASVFPSAASAGGSHPPHLSPPGVHSQVSTSSRPGAKIRHSLAGPRPRLASRRSVRASGGGRIATVRIYLVAIGDRGRTGQGIGCGDSLVPATVTIPPTTAPLAPAIGRLLANHQRYYGQSGLYNALYQSRLSVRSVTIVNQRATIRLSGTLRLGGVCDDPRVRGQLEQTALQFRTVHSVAIFVNSTPLARLLSGRG